MLSLPYLLPWLIKKGLKYHFPQLHFQSLRLQWNGTFTFQNLKLPYKNHTLYIDHLNLRPDYLTLLKGKFRIHKLYFHKGMLITKTTSKKLAKPNHFIALLRKQFDRLALLSTFLPQEGGFHNFVWCTQKDTLLQLYQGQERQGVLTATLQWKKQKAKLQFFRQQSYAWYGVFSAQERFFLWRRPKDTLSFSQLHWAYTPMGDSAQCLLRCYELRWYHPKIAIYPLKIDSLLLKGTLRFEGDSVVQLYAHHAQWNRLKGRVQWYYRLTQKDTLLRLTLQTDTFAAQALLENMPYALTHYIQGMQLAGQLSFYALLQIHLFGKAKANLKVVPYTKGFKILRYGKAQLTKLNHEFLYRPYRSKRTIWIGSKNPFYTPLEKIAPHLVEVVLTSEDRLFFHHRGFNLGALKHSLITNLRKGRFVRGGSTITMQLIKNVFLTHRKTISRKLQEIFLTWLLEHFRIVPKKRLLEVYLNLIEWGPEVYGIGEAAHFYFRRKPHQLTLSESIFLAMIIPRPRYFYRYFTESDSLDKRALYYYTLIASLLKKWKVIDESTYEKLFPPHIWVIGEARKYLPSYRRYMR